MSMGPEIPVDFPEYDYSTWLTFGGEAAGTFPIEAPFGNTPCEICVIGLSAHTAGTFILQQDSRNSTDIVGANKAAMLYCELGGAASGNPNFSFSPIWVPTNGRLTLTTATGTSMYLTAVFRRLAKIRHYNPPLSAAHHYDEHAVHVAHEEDVNARKC
jgi:hypothetical protein